MFSLIMVGVFAIVFVTVAIWSRAKIRKTKAFVGNALVQGELSENAGNPREALDLYKDALRFVLGVGPGTTEWTAKGLVERMEQEGWTVVSRMESLYEKHQVPFDLAELKLLVRGFEEFSKDKKLVDQYGLPRKAGKEIHKGLTEKLHAWVENLPGI
jgi:hypothetical protein